MALINDILTGLEIFKSYAPNSEVNWQHDIFYAGDMNIEYSKEDLNILSTHGWFESDGCFAHFN